MKNLHLSQDSPELGIHAVVAIQQRYGKGEEAIAHKASCTALALTNFRPPFNVT